MINYEINGRLGRSGTNLEKLAKFFKFMERHCHIRQLSFHCNIFKIHAMLEFTGYTNYIISVGLKTIQLYGEPMFIVTIITSFVLLKKTVIFIYLHVTYFNTYITRLVAVVVPFLGVALPLFVKNLFKQRRR